MSMVPLLVIGPKEFRSHVRVLPNLPGHTLKVVQFVVMSKYLYMKRKNLSMSSSMTRDKFGQIRNRSGGTQTVSETPKEVSGIVGSVPKLSFI